MASAAARLVGAATHGLRQTPLRDDGVNPRLKLRTVEEREAHLILRLSAGVDLCHPEQEAGKINAALQERVVDVGNVAGDALRSGARLLLRRIFPTGQELLRDCADPSLCTHRE